jgi:hypothetical protein
MFPWRHVGRATVCGLDKTVCRSVCLQKAGEVLGVDTTVAVDVATKNATLNGITHCSYFAGDAEVMIPELAKKIKYNSVRAVVTCCINNSCRSKCVVKFVWSVHYCLCGVFIIICVECSLLFVWSFHYYLCGVFIIICVDYSLLFVWSVHYYLCRLFIIIS